MTHTDVLVRIISYSIALLLVAMISAEYTLMLVIYMGQAHFILSYWYRMGTIKGITKNVWFWVWLLLLGVFSVLTIVGLATYTFWMIAATVLFVAHIIVDELHLCGDEKMSILQILLIFSGVIAVYFVEIFQFFTEITFTQELLTMLAVMTFVMSIITISNRVHISSYFRWYTIAIATCSAFALLFLLNTISLVHTLGFIILSHYFLWYGSYYVRLVQEGRPLKRYIYRSVGVNGALFLIWLLGVYGVSIPLQEYVFSQTFFYMWTCLHILFMVRLPQLRDIIEYK